MCVTNTWTNYDIRREGRYDSVIVYWSTNDDNDDGYADPETIRATYRFPNLDKALAFTGKSRIGLYGQPVDVYLDGKKI